MTRANGHGTTSLAAVMAETFDEWLHRMHGVMSSCAHQEEGDALAQAVIESDWYRDKLATAWDEGAQKRAQYRPDCSVRDLNPYRLDEPTQTGRD